MQTGDCRTAGILGSLVAGSISQARCFWQCLLLLFFLGILWDIFAKCLTLLAFTALECIPLNTAHVSSVVQGQGDDRPLVPCLLKPEYSVYFSFVQHSLGLVVQQNLSPGIIQRKKYKRKYFQSQPSSCVKMELGKLPCSPLRRAGVWACLPPFFLIKKSLSWDCN